MSCTDVTYIPLQRGFLYLVAVMVTGSRRVTGGSLAFVFLIHTCRVMLDVSPTLTTATLHDSRWGWFEAGS